MIFLGQKYKLIETLLAHRRKYCIEDGKTSIMTTPRSSSEALEEATFLTNKEEALATTVKKVYLTPKLVFNSKVKLSATIEPSQKTSAMNTISANNDVDGYSLQDLNENTLSTTVASETMRDIDQKNLLGKTASTMVGTTTTDNMPMDKVEIYNIKTLITATSRSPMSGAESSSVASPIPSGSSDVTTFLTGELVPANKSLNNDSKV